MLALNILNAKALIAQAGAVGVLAIIFAETGLLVGFFFPGDSMLVLAGVAASGAAAKVFGPGVQMPIGVLAVGTPLAAVAGAQLGHLIGAKAGRRIFDRPNSRLFKAEYVEKAEYYFTKFGPSKAVLLARFIPVVRTFLNPVAGMLEMPTGRFLLWNVIGGVAWTESMLMIGYVFGDSLASVIDKYMIPAVLLIVLLSALPILIEFLRGRKAPAPATTPAPVAETAGYGDGQGYGNSPRYGNEEQFFSGQQPQPPQEERRPSGGGRHRKR